MNKLLVASFLATATASAAFADVEIHPGYGCGFANNNIIRVNYRHVPLSNPHEPYHETYRKNLGEVRKHAPKPIANPHAKQSAAQTDAIRYAAKAERTQRSSISVYSNVTALQSVSTPASGGHNITINNSTVVINNN